MKKIHKFKSNTLLFFKSYAALLNSIYNLKLSEMQTLLLAEIMRYNNKYKHMSDADKAIMLLCIENKKEWISNLGLDIGTINNLITKFRIKKILKDRLLDEKFAIYPEKDNEIVLQLMVNDI